MIEFILASIVGLLLIAKAGDVFVDSACRVARSIGVPQATIALTLVAFATSAPEFFTAIIAAGAGNTGIPYGDVVGSNIVNITPILALAVVFGMARVNRGQLGEGVIMLAVGGALAAMALNGVIEPIEGLLLLAIFALFLRFVVKRERMRRKSTKQNTTYKQERLSKLLLLFVIGTAGVIVGSWLLIFGGAGIARTALVAAGLTLIEAEAAVGFTIIAIGTSIPELATIVISIRKKLPEISVGTIVGSCTFNAAFITGCAALIRPLAVDSQALWFSTPMMLAVMALLVGFMWGRRRLTRGQGIALFVFYAVYLAGLVFLYGPGRGTLP
ncbi:MAG: calcium/sodium antiporter [Hadesarchaea archaeon]|nr:calcium/sodium antiporter [Hadesarchaea archaeon]